MDPGETDQAFALEAAAPAAEETIVVDNSESETDLPPQASRQWGRNILFLMTTVLALMTGLGMGYIVWGASPPPPTVMYAAPPAGSGSSAVRDSPLPTASNAPSAAPTQGPAPTPVSRLVTLPESYTLPIRYGALGPQLVKAGVIDLPAFEQVFTASGDPLTPAQQAIVRDGSDVPVTIDRKNAHFLLNFFWAVGLANRNPLLSKGPLQANGGDDIEQFASTGGWTLAAQPIKEIVGAVPLFALTAAQQKRLETVAAGVYRPCCGNSTAFPDCNHGMAMLGLLELMAANKATEEQMFTAAKYLNTFWFPQQMAEVAAFFKLTENLDYAAIDPQLMVGQDIASASGFQAVHQWLADHGHLRAPSGDGASCST